MNLKMPSRQTQSWVLSMLAMAVISAPALAADEQLDSKSKSLDTQVVLGSGSKISILENPASVSVVTEEDIQKNPAIGIADQLRNLPGDRKSTRLNSSHVRISYAVFCLKKKNK